VVPGTDYSSLLMTMYVIKAHFRPQNAALAVRTSIRHLQPRSTASLSSTADPAFPQHIKK